MAKKKKSKELAGEKSVSFDTRRSVEPDAPNELTTRAATSNGMQVDEEEEEDDDEMGGLFSNFAGTNPSLVGESSKENVVEDPELEKERMKLLISKFDSEQMSRYEAFRRANVNRSSVKKLANSVLNQSITANVAVALSSASKVFVGEVMEKAREVQDRMDPPGPDELNTARPIKPEHLREAWRLLKIESGTVPAAHWRRQGGEGDGMMFR